jgi:threonine/homoserine/homoserine lactone efflux protein
MPWFEPGAFLIFLVAATVLAVTPGPGMTYVLARTVAGGRGEGLASSLGTGVGGLAHVVAAALGLSAVLARSALMFSLIKYVGACFLVYLGIRLLLSSGATRPLPALRRAGTRRAFLEGLVTEVLNVKTALFFLAFVPQFVDPGAPALGQFVALGLVCVLLNTSVDVIVVLGASRLLAGRRATLGRWLTAGSGCTLVGLGAYVALSESRR